MPSSSRKMGCLGSSYDELRRRLSAFGKRKGKLHYLLISYRRATINIDSPAPCLGGARPNQQVAYDTNSLPVMNLIAERPLLTRITMRLWHAPRLRNRRPPRDLVATSGRLVQRPERSVHCEKRRRPMTAQLIRSGCELIVGATMR